MAVPNGLAALAWFEWGTDNAYGNSSTPVDIGNGRSVIRLTALLQGLAPGTEYHYRLIASNSVGAVYGADGIFATGLRISVWDYPQYAYGIVPSGLTNVAAIGSGHGHYLLIRDDGSVGSWWGIRRAFVNDYGQTNVPPDLSNVVYVAGGWNDSFAVMDDGTVRAWGSFTSPTLPAYVPAGLSNIIMVAAGDSHALALREDGIVIAWGGNGSGQINVPHGLSNVVAIAAGSTHSLALKADGKVVAWGSSVGGSMTPPSNLSNVVAVSSEGWHNLALRKDGTVAAWGYNGWGELNIPAGLSNVVAVSAGFEHSLALKMDGTLVAWGYTGYVARVPALSNVANIASGDYHSLALSPANLPPLAFSNPAAGLTNADIVIPLRGWDANGDPLSMRITSPPTNGTLYQATSTGRGGAITVPDTWVTDASQRVVFAPAPDVVGAPYTTIGFVANDGEYDSGTALIPISVIPPPVIQNAGFLQNTNPGFALSFAGFSNLAYSVQSSSDLQNWSRLGTATQPTPGQFFFVDNYWTNSPKRSYRLSFP
jgi:hypothetical protein